MTGEKMAAATRAGGPTGNEAHPARSFTKTDRFVRCDGRQLWVRFVVPDRPAAAGCLLFVHGNTFPAISDFDLPREGSSFVEALASRGIASCLFDHRGYGRSFKPTKAAELGIDARARDIEAVYDVLVGELRRRHVTLVGVSTGCVTIARFLQVRSPEVSSLVFLGPNYVVNPRLLRLVQATKLLFTLRRLLLNGDDYYFSFSARTLRKRLADGEDGRISTQAVDQFIEAAMKASGPEATRLRSPVMGFIDPRRRYGLDDTLFDASCIKQPLMIVRGGRDDFCCEHGAERLVADVGRDDVTLATVPDAKHDLHLYPRPDGVFSMLCDFVLRTWRHGRGDDDVDTARSLPKSTEPLSGQGLSVVRE